MQKHNGIKLIGTVRGFQKDNISGLVIPETVFQGKNLISAPLQYYLAYKIGTNTTDQAVDNRFTTGGTLSSGDNGYDGIAYGGVSSLTGKLDTDINAGGDNATSYIEFSGSIAGPVSISSRLYLGWNYVHASTNFTKTYAIYSIGTVDVDSGRTFYFYWRFTLA